MSQIIDGKKNIQILGDNNNINVERKLSIPTKETSFSAKLSNVYVDFLKYALIICILLALREISPSLDYMKNYNVLLLLIAMFTSDYIAKLIGNQIFIMKIKYENGCLIFSGKEYAFYKDIWAIQYNKSILGFGAYLTIYAYDPYTAMPETHKAMFINDGEAKYIFDSFHDQHKLEEYLKTTNKEH